MLVHRSLLPCVAVSLFASCIADTGPTDDARASVEVEPRYAPDLDVVRQKWGGHGPAIGTIEDAFRVHVKVGPQTVVADTHLFGPTGTVIPIPYHDADGVGRDATGDVIARGDVEIARYFGPGEIGYAIKHHRQEHRELSLEGAGPEMKENFKLQDTHIELVVGVIRDGQPGVITLNNPQGYPGGEAGPGRFGDETYPMIFVRPVMPAYLSPDLGTAFVDNIRTMMVAFNAVSKFPGSYNGGDPLAARDPEKVREHVRNMILAIAGDPDEQAAANAWFADPANLIYCAELAHVATSAGLIVPLNRWGFEQLGLSDAVRERFAASIATQNLHDLSQTSPFVEHNANKLSALVEMTMAPEDLRPAASYAPGDLAATESQKLAFGPMTMSDIVEQFMATHLPRRSLGEALAPVQGAVLQAMKPGLLEAMAMDQLPATDPKRVAVEALFDRIVGVAATPHDSYEAFRADIAPLLAQARAVTGPRGDSGVGLFVPPSLLHIIARDTENPPPGAGGWHLRGLLTLRYVGHGIPFSMMRPLSGGAADPAPVDDDVVPDAPGTSTALEETGSLAEGEWRTWTIVVPPSTAAVRVELTSQGDADLYVRRAEPATEDLWDCRPYEGADLAETCEIASPAADTYFVMLHGYTASQFTVRATLTSTGQ